MKSGVGSRNKYAVQNQNIYHNSPLIISRELLKLIVDLSSIFNVAMKPPIGPGLHLGKAVRA